MLRKIPPLETMEAFLVAGRSANFKLAAAELALSPSAFSRRIQQLEHFLGAQLFDRSGPTAQLTEAGVRYLTEIGPPLDTLRRATGAFRQEDKPVRLATSHSLALGWMMPRMAGLLGQDCDVDLVVGGGLDNLRAGRADVALTGGPEAPADYPSEVLIDLEGVPVAAPHMADGRAPPQDLTEISRCRLLSPRTPPDFWRIWLGDQVEAPKVFDTLILMYEAAASGLGITVGIPIAAERYLQDGRLKPCLAERRRLGSQYRLVYKDEPVRRRRQVRRLAQWLRAEVDDSRRAFEQLVA